MTGLRFRSNSRPLIIALSLAQAPLILLLLFTFTIIIIIIALRFTWLLFSLHHSHSSALVALICCLRCTALICSGDVVNISVDTRRFTHTLNPLHLGCHSDSGFAHTERGFYSQMIFGVLSFRCNCETDEIFRWTLTSLDHRIAKL